MVHCNLGQAGNRAQTGSLILSGLFQLLTPSGKQTSPVTIAKPVEWQ